MSTLNIGDEVTLPQGQRAVSRWIGHIPGRQPTEFAGVEVLGPEAELHGKHSGVYQGQQIFQTSRPHTGLFISYTQSLSCNITAPPFSPGTARGFPIESNYFGSPSKLKNGTSLVSSRAPSPMKERTPPAAEESYSKQIQQQRQFFREAMAAANAKSSELADSYDSRVAAMRKDFDDQSKRARRSSAMYNMGSEVEEQRIALASMQNKLINERTEKQKEIDKLKNELSHMRKLAGNVEDLETLIAELENSERQLAQLRTQVNDMDSLKKQLSEAMQHTVELELESQAVKSKLKETDSKNKSASSSADTTNNADMVSREEHARSEKMLESKLLREAESEADNEALQQKIKELEEARLQQMHSEKSETAEKLDRAQVDTDTANQHDISMMDAVPVPDKLVSYDDSMDIAAGRSDWCSLCERQGHVTTECPF